MSNGMWGIPVPNYESSNIPRLLNLKNGEYVDIVCPSAFKLHCIMGSKAAFTCADREYTFWTHEAREAGLIKPEQIDATIPNLGDHCQKQLTDVNEPQHVDALLDESIIKIEYGE